MLVADNIINCLSKSVLQKISHGYLTLDTYGSFYSHIKAIILSSCDQTISNFGFSKK